MASFQDAQKGPTIGERLRISRKAKGLSMRAVAEQVADWVSVSHSTIGLYERDVHRPPIEVLQALSALYDRPLTWLLGSGHALSGVRYRNLKSRVNVSECHGFVGTVQRWIDAYKAIERVYPRPFDGREELSFELRPGEQPAAAAARLRTKLKLADRDPVLSVIDILQRLGVRVLGIDTDLAIDGLAATHGDEHVVVLRNSMPNDRMRLTAAHELKHILFQECAAGKESKEEERGAFEFASHLLLTPKMLELAFQNRSMVELVEYKTYFGISMAAMVYRAADAGVITQNEAKCFWVEFATRGWRNKEPGQVWPDRPTRFESIIDHVHFNRNVPLSTIAETGGVREHELRARLDYALGQSSTNDRIPAVKDEAPWQELRLVGQI